jgi:hypothetical protein
VCATVADCYDSYASIRSQDLLAYARSLTQLRVQHTLASALQLQHQSALLMTLMRHVRELTALSTAQHTSAVSTDDA